MMLVLALIAIIAAIAYPRVTDTLRKLRARDGAKAIVNAMINARAQSLIRNVAHKVTLVASSDVGAHTTGAGGTVTVSRSSGSSCTANGMLFTFVESYDFSTLNDVNLCLIRTTSNPVVDTSTTCQAGTVDLCITPDGTITNLVTPAAATTLVYVREYENATSTPTATGVVRQIVIPRRKTIQAMPIQVSDDSCL
jgi:Tfp pilus assembly protein FimT